VSIYSPYEFREPVTGRKAADFNVAYAVGKWWLERKALSEICDNGGFRSDEWMTQVGRVEYWRRFCEEEFGIKLK
jgi:hypothetical protein